MKFRALAPALLAIGGLLGLRAVAQSRQPAAADAKTLDPVAEREIISAARDRADALTSHDCARWASHVADDFQDIEAFGAESHDTLLNDCRHDAHSVSVCKSERELSDFHFRFAGNFAFVDYLYKLPTTAANIAGQALTTRWIPTRKGTGNGSLFFAWK